MPHPGWHGRCQIGLSLRHVRAPAAAGRRAVPGFRSGGRMASRLGGLDFERLRRLAEEYREGDTRLQFLLLELRKFGFN